MSKSFSISDLDATKASDKPHEFEVINDGEFTGIFLKVLGAESETVTAEVARLINDRRRKEAARQAKTKFGKGTNEVVFDPLESDVEFGQRIAAVRLVGWRGPGQTDGLTPAEKERFTPITDPWSPENALKLCRVNRKIAAQVTEQSEETANFIKL